MDSKLSERSKRSIMMMGDAILLPLALWASVVLRHGNIQQDMSEFWWLFPLAALIGVLALQKFGLYRAVVRYIGPSSMLPVIQGVTVVTIAVSLIAYLTQSWSFPRSAPIIFWFISLLFIGGVRVTVRAYFYGLSSNYRTREPIAIYGAGESGAQLAITLLNGMDYIPVAFIDDDRSLRKNVIRGIRVYDSRNLDRLVADFGIKQIFLAVPSATAEQRSVILNKLALLPILVKTVPTFNDMLSGVALNDVSQVEIGDLLGREMVPAQQDLIDSCINRKSVLVTGAGGTIGSELCRKILTAKPARLILYDNSEFALYKIEKVLKALCDSKTELVVLLGSIMNKKHLSTVMKEFGVDTVYHAAAFKHVPMVERNIIEGVRNNVVGTWNVADVAFECAVKHFVLISSDKAVRPTNVMGATKRLAELIVQAYSQREGDTVFSMVRFGNVLKSSGSVVPLFEEQILNGGPVTVTHKDATRYFMTAVEAAELVIQAGSMARGGELFVLDMGEPVRIHDLAVKMIHLHGKEVALADSGNDESIIPRIEIEYVGLRPGEKLFEELIIGQSVSGTKHSKIMMPEEDCLPFEEMFRICEKLQVSCEISDYQTVKELLEKNVSGYAMYVTTSDPVMLLALEPSKANNVTPLVRNED